MITPQIDVEAIMNEVFKECHGLRIAGQAEYAHSNTNALANFERVAERTGISRESVLFVYMQKHIDGIASYVQGYESQRESVTDRINDAIVYLVLLRCMVHDKETPIDDNSFVQQSNLVKKNNMGFRERLK